MAKLTINQAVQIFNVLDQTIRLNDGVVPGGLDWAFTRLKDEVAAIQKGAEVSKKEVNEFLKEIGDKPSQVIISLSEKDLPEKTPAGLSGILSPIMERPEIKSDYYTKLLEKYGEAPKKKEATKQKGE